MPLDLLWVRFQTCTFKFPAQFYAAVKVIGSAQDLLSVPLSTVSLKNRTHFLQLTVTKSRVQHACTVVCSSFLEEFSQINLISLLICKSFTYICENKQLGHTYTHEKNTLPENSNKPTNQARKRKEERKKKKLKKEETNKTKKSNTRKNETNRKSAQMTYFIHTTPATNPGSAGLPVL